MKKLIISLFAVLGLCGSSCSYLDMSPDLGIQEEDIFTSYNNTWQYFQTVYYREFSGHAARKQGALPEYLHGGADDYGHE